MKIFKSTWDVVQMINCYHSVKTLIVYIYYKHILVTFTWMNINSKELGVYMALTLIRIPVSTESS